MHKISFKIPIKGSTWLKKFLVAQNYFQQVLAISKDKIF
jgi:hypothetical protein